ncbi:hypothetical protein RhiJN_25111 [Ceratobasidium sp. AG-Ba]|nr:hypothetical protein RhiJN_25111 [Ceratobasidium sp. AG-Ba]
MEVQAGLYRVHTTNRNIVVFCATRRGEPIAPNVSLIDSRDYWSVLRFQHMDNGYQLVFRDDPGMVIGFDEYDERIPIKVMPLAAGPQTIWQVTPAGGGKYHIQATKPNKYWTVLQEDYRDSPIQLEGLRGEPGQSWFIEPVND